MDDYVRLLEYFKQFSYLSPDYILTQLKEKLKSKRISKIKEEISKFFDSTVPYWINQCINVSSHPNNH